MNLVKIGVIGCGVMGKIHAEVAATSHGLQLFAVADVRREAAEQLAAQYNVQAYGSAKALLNDTALDVVVIALPTHLRTPIAFAALKAGKHVLLEKPVAMNVAQVKRLIAARGDRVVAVCSSRYRFFDSARAAAAVIARGELGDIRVVHFRGMLKDNGPKNNPPAWRVSRKLNGGGFWVNLACYDLDYMLGLTGWKLRPRVVLAQTWPVADHLPSRVAEGSDAEEHAIAFVRCDGGTVLNMERGESLSIDAESTWQIIGSKASLRLNMLKTEDNRVLLDRTEPASPLKTEIVWQGDLDNKSVHRGPLNDLAAAIRDNRPPMTSLENALVMQQITDALYASADKGKAITIR